jgi:hypothetical protein
MKAEQLVKEAKLLNLARMANIVVDLFGLEDAFKRVGEREGQEIEMRFPSLEGSFNFTLVTSKKNFECRIGEAQDPIAIIIINVKKEKTIKILSNIIKLPDNMIGILKILPKYLTRKIKIKGSFIAAIKLCRCMMIGKNQMYKRGK